MCLKRVEKKKLSGRQNKVAKWLFNYIKKIQKQPLEVFFKKAVLLKTSQYSQDEQESTNIRVSF